MNAELDFGNARVRSIKSRLFDTADYARFLAMDLDQLASALADSPYRSDLQAVIIGGAGRIGIQRAITMNLARTLRTVISSYDGEARKGLELLCGRWDVHNLLCVFRGQARGSGADEIAALFVPAGSLDDVALRELAKASSVRAALELMNVWGLPSRRMATRLMDIWMRYESQRELLPLEHALVRHYAERISEAANLAPAITQPLRNWVDKQNIMIALRQRRERSVAAPSEQPDLPGGTLDHGALESSIQRPSRDEAVSTLLGARLHHPFADALGHWVADGDLGRLEERLEEVIGHAALRGFSGDALSIAVPVAFVFAKEMETRRLRLVVEATAGRLPRDEVSERWRG